MAFSVQEELLIEARVANEAKSTGVAYALWFFFGIISLHRFYLGRPISAILQIMSYFIIVGIAWWFADAFLIPGMVDKQKQKVRMNMMARFIPMAERDSRT